MVVSTEHTYKRCSSALSLKTTVPAKDDNKVVWGTRECNFKIGSFTHNEPDFIESPMAKFDMLALNRLVLPVGCNVSQLRTIGLGIFVRDGSVWVGKNHNFREWFTPSRD